MISQPIVCGPLFGYLMGQVAVGVIIGGIVQLLWMDLSPIGVGIPYDATATTIAGCLLGDTAGAQCALASDARAHHRGSVWILFRSVWISSRGAVKYVSDAPRRERFGRATLLTALWAGILVGIAWSWIRYTVLYGVIFAAGEFAWNRFAYSPRLTPIDQGLTMAIILLPVAGMGVTLELFLSEEPERRWAPWRAAEALRAG